MPRTSYRRRGSNSPAQTHVRFATSLLGLRPSLQGCVLTSCAGILIRLQRASNHCTRAAGNRKKQRFSDELTDAFVVVLEELTPPQRVALVLHDAFGVPFEEIAHVLDTSVASAKKFASRARARVRRRTDIAPDDYARARQAVDAFLHAAQHGDTERLLTLLDPQVVRMADAYTLPPNGSQRIQGVDAVVAEVHAQREKARGARVANVDGSPGMVCLDGSSVLVVFAMRIQKGRIVRYEVIGDPQRIALMHVEMEEPSSGT